MSVTWQVLEKLKADLDRAGEIPERFFGELDGMQEEKERQLSVRFRQFARACYPDHAPEEYELFATEITQHLNLLHALAKRKIEMGSYGDHRPVPPGYRPATLSVGGEEIHLTGLIGDGLYSRVHKATMADSPAGGLFMKVANDPADNDLLEREYHTLSALHTPCGDPMRETEFFAVQRQYVPTPLRMLTVRGNTGATHRAALYQVPEDRCFTARELRQRKFPDGIEPRHVWWIFRRLLLTLWMAHLYGYAHGAVTPDHLLIYPEAHGLVLLDWTHASRIDSEYLPGIDPAMQVYYPPEVWDKERATAAMDIYLAAATMIYLLGGDVEKRWIPATVPEPLQRSLLSCLSPDPRKRPQDAERYHNEFGRLLGPRYYSEFLVP